MPLPLRGTLRGSKGSKLKLRFKRCRDRVRRLDQQLLTLLWLALIIRICPRTQAPRGYSRPAQLPHRRVRRLVDTTLIDKRKRQSTPTCGIVGHLLRYRENKSSPPRRPCEALILASASRIEEQSGCSALSIVSVLCNRESLRFRFVERDLSDISAPAQASAFRVGRYLLVDANASTAMPSKNGPI